jgi:hypothetical protein
MVEEVQKIKIEELGTVRIIYEDGDIVETSLSKLENKPPGGLDAGTAGALKSLSNAVRQLSNKGTKFGIEFVIPVKH